MGFKNYWNELKRRNVIKAAIAYLVVAWLITQVLSIILPAFEAPSYVLKIALVILLIGFPIWIVFSWVYEFTPDGIRKTEDIEPEKSIMPKTGSRLNRVIILALSVAVVFLIYDKITQKPVKVVDTGAKSIAVLAFADMSPNKDHEYFSDGISEELLNLLAKIPDLKVISRTSSFSYKGKDATATDIGKELSVSHILEGSIRKAGNTIRVTAQLINTSDGSHEWSHTYDRELDSIFKVQDNIAKEVSNQLQLTLLDQEKPLVKNRNVDAYNLYLQALHLIHQNTREGYIKAKEITEKSIAIDSTFSRSWDLLASIYVTGSYNFSIGDGKSSLKSALIAAEKAIYLDPESADAHITLASVHNKLWNFKKSNNSIEKALQLSPNNAIILGTAALMTYGDLEKSVSLLKKAIEIDPLIYVNHYNLGFAYLRMQRFEEAEKAFNEFSLYYPSSQILPYMKSMLKLHQGKTEEALIEIEKESHEFFNIYGKNFIYYTLDKDETKELFAKFLEMSSEKDPSNVADLYAFRGDYDLSFEYLNKALEVKDPVLLEALTYPSFDPMRSDSRWDELIDKMKLPKNHGYK